MGKLTLKIVSDVHLELYNKLSKSPLRWILQESPGTDVLALLGDIGYPGSSLYMDFVRELAASGKFKHILIITGNHEYYKTSKRNWTKEQVDKFLAEFCSEIPNVHFLNDSSIEIGGCTFVGSTLWTNIPTAKLTYASYYMNDYNSIITESGSLKPSDTVSWHLEAVNFIKKIVSEAKPVVILTHHCPSVNPVIWPVLKRDKKSLPEAYATDLETPECMPDTVLLWGYGHTHHPSDFTAKNGVTQIVSNPMGYKGQFKFPTHHQMVAKKVYTLNL